MASGTELTAKFSIGKRVAVALVAACVVSAWTIDAYADPPPWAPAHGYRAKGKHKNKRGKGRNRYDDHYEEAYVVPYGIGQGTCNRQLLGTVVGGATGALIGSQITKGDGKGVATLGGAIIGAIIGGSIGRSMDQVDQGCIGQALEHAEDGQRVTWTNPDNGGRYTVEPAKTYQTSSGEYCREYTVVGTVSGREQNGYGTACRQADGSWKIVN